MPEQPFLSESVEQCLLSTQEEIEYIPLPLPKYLEQYKLKSLNEAFEKFYSIGNNSFFQCTKQEFRYWFGGSMGMNFDAKTECKRINWKRGKYTLQYLIIRLYRPANKGRLSKGMWEKVRNVFLLDNKPILSGTLGKNVEKIGQQDKEDIDNMFQQFKKAME